MERFLGLESKFARVMTRVADLAILNAIFLISCLPIFTIGSAVAALYSVTLKMCRDEESYVIRGYLKVFRKNFFRTTAEWVVVLFTGAIIWMDFRMFDSVPGEAVKTGLVSVFVLWGLIVPYVFPVAAWFQKSILKTFKMAILLSLRYFGYTVLILTGSFVPVFCIWKGGETGTYCIAVLLTCGFSTMAFLYSYLYRIIFAHYE